MPTATPKEISEYLDDMKAGTDAGPVGTPEFRQAVHESQERRKRGTRKAFWCEGCGEWLDEHEIEGPYGRSHARTIRDERGDALSELCGPVRRASATPIDPDGGRS